MADDGSKMSESDLIVARWTVVQGTSAIIALIVATVGMFLTWRQESLNGKQIAQNSALLRA